MLTLVLMFSDAYCKFFLILRSSFFWCLFSFFDASLAYARRGGPRQPLSLFSSFGRFPANEESCGKKAVMWRESTAFNVGHTILYIVIARAWRSAGLVPRAVRRHLVVASMCRWVTTFSAGCLLVCATLSAAAFRHKCVACGGPCVRQVNRGLAYVDQAAKEATVR